MSKYNKYSPEQIVKICEEYISGKKSTSQLCIEYGMSKGKPPGRFWHWVAQYREKGAESFFVSSVNKQYTSDFKKKVVREYLDGYSSVIELCVKYQISSESMLYKWISLYNANKELKDYTPNREVYMAEARRKTTFEERIEITKYCIEHDKDYKGTATIYDVSYNQVYAWVRKYLQNGEEGLIDKRGCHKTDAEVNEMERLRRENQRLKRKLEEQGKLVELLKKVKGLEGM